MKLSKIKLFILIMVMAPVSLIGFRMCFGQSTADELDSTGLTAAGPRPGPVAIVEVKLINRQALSKLIRHGFDISYAQSDLAIAYAIQKELDWLDKAGHFFVCTGQKSA